MYSPHICQPRQDLLHPDADANERELFITNIDAQLRELFSSVGIPEEHVQCFKWNDLVQQTISWGQLPMSAQLHGLTVVKDDVGDDMLAAVHPSVAQVYKEQWPYIKHQCYVFTRGEDWWKGEPVFLVSDAHSFLLSLLYTMSAGSEQVRNFGPKKRGRPANPEARAAKEAKAERYQQWLQDCSDYRSKLNNLKTAYESALKEYLDYKAQGAPKWIP